MAKIIVDGEAFDYEAEKQLTHEALWIEHVYKRNYLQWQEDMTTGGTRALCMLACLLWRRDGRNVDTAFQDLLDGKIQFDLNEMWASIIEAGQAAQREAEAEQKAQAEADPTISGTSPDPDGSPTTGTGTSSSSPANSGSGRGKSASSTSRTSKR